MGPAFLFGGQTRSHCLIPGQEAVTGQGEAMPDHSYPAGCLSVVSKKASGFLIVVELKEVCSKIAAS